MQAEGGTNNKQKEERSEQREYKDMTKGQNKEIVGQSLKVIIAWTEGQEGKYSGENTYEKEGTEF